MNHPLLALTLFVLAVGVHLGLSMELPAVSVLSLLLAPLALVGPVRPAPPSAGLAFITVVSGGLLGYFFMAEVAPPGSWPALFQVLAGVTLAGWVLLNWLLLARAPPGRPTAANASTESLLMCGLALGLLTPSGAHVRHVAPLQVVMLLCVLVVLVSEHLRGRRKQRLMLLLPLLVLVPAATALFTAGQAPLLRSLHGWTPDWAQAPVGFSPLQQLQADVFLRPSTRVALRVHGDLPEPYLVGNRLDRFEGRSLTWRAAAAPSPATVRTMDDNLSWHRLAPVAPEARWSQRIESLRWDDLVFVPPGATEVGLAGSLSRGPNQVLEADFAGDADRRYWVRGAPREADAQRPANLELPPLWDAELQARAASLRRSSARATAQAVHDHFVQREYRLGAQLDPRRPLHDFFLNDKPAYCYWYATAAALALRANGIPSRVVAGYLVHEQLARGLWLVRERDAHAWIEWQAPDGVWHTLDPTPPSIATLHARLEGSALSRWRHRIAAQLGEWWHGLDLGGRLGDLLVLISVLVLVGLFWREYQRLRRGTGPRLDARQRRWQRLWGRFLRIARLPEEAGWTAADYGAHLPEEWPRDRRARAREFLSLYARHRFAPGAPPFERLEACLRRIRRG